MPVKERNSLVDVLRVLSLRAIGVLLAVASAFLLAVMFGASAIVDAFFFARRTIGSFQSISEVLIETLLVPRFVSKARRDGGQSLRGLTRRTELLLFVGSAAVCALLALASGYVVDFLAPGLAAESRGPARLYFSILLITIPIILVTSINSATLLALRHFSRPALARLLPRLFLVIAILAIPLGVQLTWAVVAFVIGNVLMLVVFFRLTEDALSRAKTLPDTTESDAESPSKPGHAAAIIIFAICALIETTLDTLFASMAGVGALAVLTIGQRISNVGATELNRSLLSVYYTNFAEHAAAQDRKAYAKEVATAMRAGLFFLAPLGFFLFALADPLCRVLLDFGAFSDESLRLTAQVVALVAIATVLRSPNAVLENAVLADMSARHTPFAAWSTALSLLTRVLIVVPLLPMIGLIAVVWSAIGATLLKLLFGLFWLRKEGGIGFSAQSLREMALVLLLGIAASGLAGTGVAMIPDSAPRLVTAAGLLGATALCVALYLVLAARLKLPEAAWTLQAILRKLGRKAP